VFKGVLVFRFKNYKVLGFIFFLVLFFLSGEILKLVPGIGDAVKSFSSLNSAYPEYDINFKASKSGYITITAAGSASSQFTEEDRCLLAKEMAKLAISSYKDSYKSVIVTFVTQSVWEKLFEPTNTDVNFSFNKESINTYQVTKIEKQSCPGSR
jgi:hypothetical protein